jgi:drug/metabolite transporter (DMT)-like permease
MAGDGEMERRWGADVMAAIACCLWGSAFLFGKICLAVLPPMRLAGIRLLLASLMMVPFLHGRPFQAVKGKWGTLALLSLFQTIITFTIFNYGLRLVPGSLGSMVVGTSPAISMVIAFIAVDGEHWDTRSVLAMTLGLLGIVMLTVSRDMTTPTGKREFVGILLLLFQNVTSAYGSVLAKRIFAQGDMLAVNFLQTLLGGCVVMGISLGIEHQQVGAVGLPVVVSVLALSAITAGATSLWFFALQRPEVYLSRLSAWKLLIPSVGSVFSWLLLPDDNPTAMMIGGLLVISGSILLTVGTRKGKLPHVQGECHA